jgi:hypothetical protein
MYGPYFDILWDFMVRVENGELSPAEAAEATVAQLQAEIGEFLIVE